MTCAELRELAGLYAAGALAGEELAAAEAHLEEPRHEGCFEALRRASAGTELLARSLVLSPPDERLWQAIEARLGGAARAAAIGLRERVAWAVAAAAALLLFATLSLRQKDARNFSAEKEQLAAAGRNSEADKARCLQELAQIRVEADTQRAAIALLQSPSAQVIALAPPPGQPPQSARALLDLPEKKGMLLSGTLSPRPGKDYELWIIRGQQKLPAGLLRAGASGVVLASIDPQLLAGAPPDALAVTLEPQGGMPQPSGPIVLVGALPKS